MMWNAEYISYKGNTNFIRAYQGAELVWEKVVTWTDEPFWVENINDYPVIFVASEGTIMGNYISGKNEGVLFSFDKETWQDLYDIKYQGHVTIPPHTKMYLINDTDVDFESTNTGNRIYNLFSIFISGGNLDIDNYAEFNMGGNFHSILYNWNEQVRNFKSDNACHGLFMRMKVVDASKLLLPSQVLTNSCYISMFAECQQLLKAPKFAQQLQINGDYCFHQTFKECEQLLKAPTIDIASMQGWFGCDEMFMSCRNMKTCKINVKHIDKYSFEQMFSGCQGLEYVEIIGLESVDEYGCNHMFENCTSLINAPQLSATILAEGCYYYMFVGCTSLTKAPELPATTLAEDCYGGMFSNCIGLTSAPKLPATTLTELCYNSMFSFCTSLTKAPELPATELAPNCYQSMFWGCAGLKEAPQLPATILADGCYSGMFYNCTGLTKAPELPATTLAKSCYHKMFMHCRQLKTAPELPATTLAKSCYDNMFYNCTSLATAPQLPATILADNCYQSMFYRCNALNKITCLATDMSANYCIFNWVGGVSSTGTFIKHPDAVWTIGNNGIPSGWEVIDYTE